MSIGLFRLVKRCVCTVFFFFFFSFGLTRPFRPFRPIQADTGRYGRYGPSRPDFGRVGADFRRIGADFSRVGPRRPDSGLATWHDAVRRGRDARSAASLPRPRVPPCRTRVRRPWGRVRASQVMNLVTIIHKICSYHLFKFGLYCCSRHQLASIQEE